MAITLYGSKQAIIQVVQTVKTDTFSTTTGTTAVDITGMSVSITPSSSSNKILVFVDLKVGNTNSGDNTRIILQRNGANIYTNADTTNHPAAFQQLEMSQYGASGTYSFTPMVATYLDSPASTSSVTYKLQVTKANSGGTMYVNRNNSNAADQAYTASSITVMEVAYA